MLVKFDSKNLEHIMVAENLPIAYCSHPIYLDFNVYLLENNAELIPVVQDLYNKHTFPALFAPQHDKNLQYINITFTRNSDLQRIQNLGFEIIFSKLITSEYFYETSNLIKPRKKFRSRINQFNRLYTFSINSEVLINDVIDFYNKWKRQKNRDGILFPESEELFMFILNNLDKYDVKQVYVKVDDEIVGLAWGVQYNKDYWVGLELKVLYEYKGLSRFLHQQRALFFKDIPYFTIGTGAQDVGIDRFKKELGPFHIEEYFYVITG